MKILQITHYGSLTNYGAMLQAYALQKALNELGHDVTLLRASFAFHDILRKWYKSPFRVIKACRLRRAELKAEELHPRKFAQFAATHLKLSEGEYHSHKDLVRANLTADAMVTGSDQVWGSKVPAPAYFLEFGSPDALRFSYAASVGSRARTDEAYLKAFRQKAQGFAGISVRENAALAQCQAAGLTNAVQVPDPVMLFPADQWREKLALTKDPKFGKYCLIYTVGRNAISLDPALKEYCQQKNLQIIMVPAQHHMELTVPGTQSVYPEIPEFLSLIDNAELMVTDSFHGTAFSLLFNTPFVVIPKHNYDARFSTLDEYFHVAGAYFRGNMSECLNFSFDYPAINEKICSLRQIGWDFLRRTTEKRNENN